MLASAARLSWIVFLLSVIFGIVTMQTLSGNLETKEAPSIYEGNTRLFSTLQLLMFALGLTLTLVFGFISTR